MYASRTYPITRESMTADISSSVAENTLCWWEGRSARSARRRKVNGGFGGGSEAAIGRVARFYTSFSCSFRFCLRDPGPAFPSASSGQLHLAQSHPNNQDHEKENSN